MAKNRNVLCGRCDRMPCICRQFKFRVEQVIRRKREVIIDVSPTMLDSWTHSMLNDLAVREAQFGSRDGDTEDYRVDLLERDVK